MWAKKPPLRHTLGIFADVFSPNQPPWINKLPFSFLKVRFRALNLCVQLIPTLLSFTKKLRGSLIYNLDLVIFFFLVFRRIRMWFLVRKEHAVGDLRFVIYIYIYISLECFLNICWLNEIEMRCFTIYSNLWNGSAF